MSQPKHPLYWIYSGLILLLIPVRVQSVGMLPAKKGVVLSC